MLDRYSLARCVGGGFYPGIEAGVLMRSPGLWSELGRFSRRKFKDISKGGAGVDMTLYPGALTERMACPWQADFIECHTSWWPSQRPDVARFQQDGTARTTYWGDPLGVGAESSEQAHLNMVEQFAYLGVIVPMMVGTKEVQAQTGRHAPASTFGPET